MLHAIIMAGGSGTRFWPASRTALPKQLLSLSGTTTLLENTAQRLNGLLPHDHVMVVTSARLIDAVKQQLPHIPADNVVGEPCKRDTAPCIGLAALLVARTDTDATMAVMPSDHVISPPQDFCSAIQLADSIVNKNPKRLVTFGVSPSYPAEGFGYIQTGEPLPVEGLPDAPASVYRVKSFKEKPAASVAEDYLKSGGYLWNAGIFVWKAQTIIDLLAEHQPDCLTHLQTIVAAWDTPQRDAVFAKEFSAIKGISIDYAVLEKAKDVSVIQAPFSWDDLGGWSAVARQRGADSNGNTVVGRHLGIESKNSIIQSDRQHLVVTMGVSDMLIVNTPDATLVADRTHEEAIRKIVEEIKERGWDEYL